MNADVIKKKNNLICSIKALKSTVLLLSDFHLEQTAVRLQLLVVLEQNKADYTYKFEQTARVLQ